MSLLFDGTSQGLSSPVDVAVPNPTKPMSVSFWFYPTYNPSTDTTNRMHLSFKTLTNNSFNNFFRVMKGSDKKWSVGFLINGASSLNLSSAAISTVTQNAWNHVCVTWGPGTATVLYVNGALVSLATSSHPAASYSGTDSTNMSWTQGSWKDTAAYGLPSNSYQAEFSVFNSTLSATQAAALYAGRSPLAIGGACISYYDLKGRNRSDLLTGAAGAIGTSGALTLTGTPTPSILHPTVDDPYPFVFKPLARPGSNKFVERLREWAGQETSPYVFVLDKPSGTTTVGNETGITPLTVTGPTLATQSIMPGDPRTCASFDGTDDFATIANESGIAYERTDAFVIHALIHLDQNLADGEYEIASKTTAAASYLGYRFYVTLASGSASIGAAMSDGTRTIVADTAAGTVPLGVPVLVSLLYDGSSANTAIQLFVHGDRKSVTASGTTLSSTMIDTTAIFFGKKVLNTTTAFFKGRIAALAMYKVSLASDALKRTQYYRIKSLGTLAINDTPDLFIKDVQGNVHRPGDAGYKPNVIADMDVDDDYGDPFAMDTLGQYVDAGLINLPAFLVVPRKGHTTAAGVAAAVKTTRKLSARIGTYQANDIGTTTASGFAAAIAADATLIGGGASANSAYPTNVQAFITAVTGLPDKSCVYYMGGHAKGAEAIRANATAWALFQSKVSYVVAMFGAFQPNASAIGAAGAGTLWHSDDYDGLGSDVEYNIGLNGAAAADTDVASFSAFFTALNSAAIPVVVHGWNFSVRSAVNAPAHGKNYSLLTSGSVSKTSETASGTTAGTGRSPWDVFIAWIIAFGPRRSANAGGPEWIGRGTVAFNTATDTPYAPASGSWTSGYSRFLKTPQAGYLWTLWMDDGTTGDRIGQLCCDEADKYILSAGATGTGVVGDGTISQGISRGGWLNRKR